ncbi:MAG: hypothetical protein SV062_05520 [Thermodesulfobacteriota bacterium]|nr:hypothetical protein [Thermodesulfobacteriota bacterium]
MGIVTVKKNYMNRFKCKNCDNIFFTTINPDRLEREKKDFIKIPCPECSQIGVKWLAYEDGTIAKIRFNMS